MLDRAGYRRDIDGLRAIAVLSVLIHHLSPVLLPGGYVGVDIFFVISGFLITTHIVSESSAGAFSLHSFYRRRINRIVPALATVIFTTYVAGLMLLSPADLALFSKGAVAAIIGVSNVFFWTEYGNYFGGNAHEAPLLHTWSLGVEEQFYVIWPVIIMLLLKLRREYALPILIILTVCAILISEYGTGIAASASYYLLPTRFFELMMGGALALALLNRRTEANLCTRLGFVGGLLLILFSLIWLNKSSSFPGFNAIWPCAGAALLIYAGSVKDSSSSLLENRAMVMIGLISYSLYLWHWPIIAYLNYLDIQIGLTIGMLVVLASIALAWLSWRYIETPFRKSGANQPFYMIVTCRFALPAMILAVAGAAVLQSEGLPARFSPRVAELEKSLHEKPDELRAGCHVPTALYEQSPDPLTCQIGVRKDFPDAMLLGDSFANHFTGMLDVMAKAGNISIMDYTMDGCPPILDYGSNSKRAYSEKCKKRNAAALDYLEAVGIKMAILAANWPKSKESGRKLASTIDRLASLDMDITLILSNNAIENGNSCPIRNLMFGTNKTCAVPRQGAPGYFSDILADYPNVHIIDPNSVICLEGMCVPEIEGILIYRDAGHLNDIGSRLIGNKLLEMGVRL